MVSRHTERILIADCGLKTTTLSLVVLGDDRYQLAAQTETFSTDHLSRPDIAAEVVTALTQLEAQTGLTFLDETSSLIQPQDAAGRGADAFVFVTSAASPVAVSLVGLMSGLSLNAARRAVTATYSLIDYQLSLDDEIEARDIETRVQALTQAESDLILLVGGLDGGAAGSIIDLAHLIALALKLIEPDKRPAIVYAGNSQLRLQVADILAGLSSFISIDNVRPEPDVENLTAVQAELNRLYLEHKLIRLPGVDKLLTWSKNRVISAAGSFEQSVRYTGHTSGVQILGLDIGSEATTVSLKRKYSQTTTTRVDIGLGQNISTLLAATDWDDFRRWLPFDISEAEFKNFALNKALTPQMTSQTEQDLWLELALARQAMQLVQMQAQEHILSAEDQATDWLNWDLIVAASPLLTRLSDPALATLTLLDGLQPAGLCRLVLDRNGLFRILGGLAGIRSKAAIDLVDQGFQFTEADSFLNLGMVVAPIGISDFGSTALRLQMTYSDGRKINKKIPFGAIEVIPLASNEEAELRLRPARHLSINPQWEQTGGAINATVSGGLLGVIIDVRGRPIVFSHKDEDRYQQLRHWLTQLNPVAEVEQAMLAISGVEAYAA